MIAKEQKELFHKRGGKTLEQRRIKKDFSRKEPGSPTSHSGDSAVQAVSRYGRTRRGCENKDQPAARTIEEPIAAPCPHPQARHYPLLTPFYSIPGLESRIK